eukprot:6204977-Pleurochrysis_carterae.AAC.3
MAKCCATASCVRAQERLSVLVSAYPLAQPLGYGTVSLNTFICSFRIFNRQKLQQNAPSLAINRKGCVEDSAVGSENLVAVFDPTENESHLICSWHKQLLSAQWIR